MMPRFLSFAGLVVFVACGGTTVIDPAGGGSASGGSSSGGAPGVGGAGATSTATGGHTPIPQPECEGAEDCQLVNSCCDCAGVPTGSDLPCGITECFTLACSGFHPVATQCRLGRCVTTVDCDITKVKCFQAQPECPPGQTATHDGQGCWGGCFPTEECASVASCAQCAPGQACVAEVAQLGPVFHCIDVPDTCSGAPSCACMGETVCVGAFNACVDTPEGYLACECPTC